LETVFSNYKEIAMQSNAGVKGSKRPRQIALAMLASAVAATLAQAHTPDKIVLVPPTDLPALAQQSGDAMFLHDTIDGRTLLYIEQNRGSRLTTLDVTDPLHIKTKSSVPLDSSEPFDFVAALGSKAELIQFRQNHQNGVLDLHKENAPHLKVIQAMTLQGRVTPLGTDGFVVNGQATEMPAALDYQVIETASQTLNRVFDVKQVREEVTNSSTGTTFFLTENGLYLIRRPAVESEKRRRDQEWFSEHSGS